MYKRQEGEELCESMKKGAKYKWLKRLEKNPEKVASVGDNVVKPWYLKLIAHRERMIERVEGYSKSVPEAKFSFFNLAECHGIKHHILFRNRD